MTTILNHKINPVGFGLMGLTRPDPPISKEDTFLAMNAALDNGANYWNGENSTGRRSVTRCIF